MAKEDFESFREGLNEADISNLISLAKKKRNLYAILHISIFGGALLISLLATALKINFLMMLYPFLCLPIGIVCGFGVYTHNVICFVTSRGRRDGGGVSSILWASLGGFIIPLIINVVCSRMVPKKILGWDKAGINVKK